MFKVLYYTELILGRRSHMQHRCIRYWCSLVALFTGLPTIQVLITCSMHKRTGPFYHMNDVSVCLDRQRENGVPDRKNTCVLHLEQGAVRFPFHEHLKLQWLRQKLQEKASSSFFRLGTPPCVHSRQEGEGCMIHVIKWTRSIFPLCFCILQAVKKWTVGRPRNKANIDAHMSYTSLMEGPKCILNNFFVASCINLYAEGQVTLSRLRFAFTLDCGWGCWRESGYAKLKGHFHSDTVKQSKCTTYIQHVSLIYIQISSLSLIFVRGGSRRYLCILNFNSAAIAILLRQHFRRHQQLPYTFAAYYRCLICRSSSF